MPHPLKAVLEKVGYADRFRNWLGREYYRSTLFDHPRLRPTDDLWLRFFALGEPVDLDLPLDDLAPWIEKTSASVRLKTRLSVYTVAGEPLFLFGRISATSLFLLRELISEKEAGEKYAGEAADFGSGVGVQALALLRLHPALSRVWAVESDKDSAALSELNARVNGLGDKCRMVTRLSDRELQLVVSNPASDIVPDFLKKAFPAFGFGGADGLAHAREVLRESVARLGPGGRLHLYAQWGVNREGRLLFEEAVKTEFPALKLTKVPIAGRERLRYTFWDSGSYARALARFVGATEVAPIEKAMRDEGIDRVVPLVVKLEKPA